MQAASYSVDEYLQLSAQCKQVYATFTKEYTNAPRQLSTFRDGLERVEQALKVQRQISKWTGQVCPGTAAFHQVLKDCWNFADKHRRLFARHQGKRSLRRVLQTAYTTFEQELPRLQERLARSRIDFVKFNVKLLVQRSFAGADRIFTAEEVKQTGKVSTIPDKKTKDVEKALIELFGIGYLYKRLKNTTALRAAKPGQGQLERLQRRFDDCISTICELVGLPTNPLAHIPFHELPSHVSEERRRAVIESSSQVSRYIEGISDSPVTTRSCPVVINVEGRQYCAAGYVLFQRCLYWRDYRRRIILEHRLAQSPRKCHPRTQHHFFGKPLTVSFLEYQETVVKTPFPEKALRCKPEYIFTFERQYTLFQADLRGRHLSHEFHASTVASKHSRGNADAYKECVKIWEPLPGSIDRTMTFAAILSSSMKDYELPLKWFMPPTISKSTIVRLELASEAMAQPQPQSSRLDVFKEPSGSKLSRIKQAMRRKTGTTGGKEGYAASITSVNTMLAQNSFAPKEWVDWLGYLEIKFDSPDEAKSFVRAVDRPFSSLVSKAPSTYTASTASTLSTAWSGSPSSVFSISRRPGLRRTSTAATSPTMSPSANLKLPSAALADDHSVLDKSLELPEELHLPPAHVAADADIGGNSPILSGGTPAIRGRTPSSLLSRSKNGTWLPRTPGLNGQFSHN